MTQKYDNYKDSGVQWLGMIPGHWKEVFIGRLYNIKAGGDAKPEYYSDVKDEEHKYAVYTNTLDSKQVYAYTSKPIFPANTVTVTGRGAIGHAFYRDEEYDAIVRLLVLIPKNPEIINGKYYAYYIDNVLNFTSDSAAIGQLSAVQIAPSKVCLPPLSEQRAIVSYLDVKCSQLDKLVSAKEAKIALLGEMKQRIISDAVTRGLNPNVKLKATNIPWLKEVPEHWEVAKLKSFCKDNKEKNKGNIENNVLSLSYGNIIRKANLNEGLLPDNYESYQIVQPGYIVMRLTDLQNDHRSLRTGLVKETGIITSAYVGLIVEKIDPRFTHLLLHTYDVMKVYYSMGGGLRQSMNYQDVANLPICIPPLSEQRAIVSYLDEKTSKLDALVEKLQAEIAHIKEYKQRLISDVVTGQIKVC